ncbi:hypothetical protein O1L60_27255 [Streptomyces diastatochromogenes]|nr:hypothetical protein [Streptomyces diastatochromogenes]
MLAVWGALVGGAVAAFFVGVLGTGGLAITIALASALSAAWTSRLETATGRARQKADRG